MKPIPKITEDVIAAYNLTCSVVEAIYHNMSASGIVSDQIDRCFLEHDSEDLITISRASYLSGTSERTTVLRNCLHSIMQLRGFRNPDEEHIPTCRCPKCRNPDLNVAPDVAPEPEPEPEFSKDDPCIMNQVAIARELIYLNEVTGNTCNCDDCQQAYELAKAIVKKYGK